MTPEELQAVQSIADRGYVPFPEDADALKVMLVEFAALQRENAKLRAIVQELEFGVPYYNDSDLVCPVCRQLPPSDRDPHAKDRGHLPDCALAAALTPTKEEANP